MRLCTQEFLRRRRLCRGNHLPNTFNHLRHLRWLVLIREILSSVVIVARADALEALVREQAAESNRTMAAYLGEIEDKLDRVLPPDRG